MQFLDGVTGLRQSATDGLPVRVQFENNWELGDTTRLATRADAYWTAFRGRWADLRQNFF
jgi:hypothetical protein